jgi:hypothetical protein
MCISIDRKTQAPEDLARERISKTGQLSRVPNVKERTKGDSNHPGKAQAEAADQSEVALTRKMKPEILGGLKLA